RHPLPFPTRRSSDLAALFDLADERHALDAVAGDLRELKSMLGQSEDLVRLLRSPVLSRAEQGKAVAALAERAGLSELTRNFLGVDRKSTRLNSSHLG